MGLGVSTTKLIIHESFFGSNMGSLQGVLTGFANVLVAISVLCVLPKLHKPWDWARESQRDSISWLNSFWYVQSIRVWENTRVWCWMRWGEKTGQHMVVSLFRHLRRCSQGPRELSISSWERCRIRIEAKRNTPRFPELIGDTKETEEPRKKETEVSPSPAHIPWLLLEGLWHVSEPFVTNENYRDSL